MTVRPQMIGYNRTVKLRWLDETVDLFLIGQSESEIGDIDYIGVTQASGGTGFAFEALHEFFIAHELRRD